MNQDSLWPNGPAIRAILKALGWTQKRFAKELGHNVRSSVEQAVSGKKKMARWLLQKMADTLKCQLSDIVLADNEVPAPGRSQLGTPEYCLRALDGIWTGKSFVDATSTRRKPKVEAKVFDWHVILEAKDGLSLGGRCECRSDGFEYVQYRLDGSVNGCGFVMVDGTHAIDDGSNDCFRALLQFHSTGQFRRMHGGYVMYWSTYNSIFMGAAELIWVSDRDKAPGKPPAQSTPSPAKVSLNCMSNPGRKKNSASRKGKA